MPAPYTNPFSSASIFSVANRCILQKKKKGKDGKGHLREEVIRSTLYAFIAITLPILKFCNRIKLKIRVEVHIFKNQSKV